MSKFNNKANARQEIPTSALPDIIFMLLFFFMVTTVMRESEVMVEQNMPRATQLKKLEKKNLVSYIYVGTPTQTQQFGEEPRIQVNDVFISTRDIVQYVEQERMKLPPEERSLLIISLKVDNGAMMGLVSDIQEELRKADALKVLYATPAAPQSAVASR